MGNIQKAVDTGFPRIKLKTAPGWDLDMLTAVTSTFPKMTFHIDCNSGYTLDDLPFFKSIDDMGLAFIEQPLHYADVLDHAELARQIQTPVCLDETIVSVKAAEQAVQVGAAQYINIKPGRIGGLSNALAVHDLCQGRGSAGVDRGNARKRARRGVCVWRWRRCRTSPIRATSSPHRGSTRKTCRARRWS